MALRPTDIITSARDRHPSFDVRNIPNGVALRWLSEYQRTLVQKGHTLDRYWLAQPLGIFVTTDSATVPGVAGAGVGSLPVGIASDGSLTVDEAPAGALATIDFASVTPDFAPRVPSVIGVDSLTFTGAGWTVNQWAAFVYYAYITDGPGVGGARKVTANTADTLSFLVGEVWSNGAPTAASRVAIIKVSPDVDASAGVFNNIPTTTTRRGFMVKLDASGNPYVDSSTPLLLSVEHGVPLPPSLFISDIGVVRFTKPKYDPDTFRLVPPGQRQSAHFIYSGYVMNQTLYLMGTKQEWAEVQGIDLRYVPIPPVLATLTDLLLLPDHASTACVEQMAAFFGRRLVGATVDQLTLSTLAGAASDAEQVFLETIGRKGRARTVVVRDVR